MAADASHGTPVAQSQPGDAPIFDVRGLVKHFPIGTGLSMGGVAASFKPLMALIFPSSAVKPWVWSEKAAAVNRQWRAP